MRFRQVVKRRTWPVSCACFLDWFLKANSSRRVSLPGGWCRSEWLQPQCSKLFVFTCQLVSHSKSAGGARWILCPSPQSTAERRCPHKLWDIEGCDYLQAKWPWPVCIRGDSWVSMPGREMTSLSAILGIAACAICHTLPGCEWRGQTARTSWWSERPCQGTIPCLWWPSMWVRILVAFDERLGMQSKCHNWRRAIVLENVGALLSRQSNTRKVFQFIIKDLSIRLGLFFCHTEVTWSHNDCELLLQEARKRGLRVSWTALQLHNVGLAVRPSSCKASKHILSCLQYEHWA